jgi:AraC family transcriptional regulator, alkane utilization regulator
MDVLTDVLHTLRLNSSVYCRSEMSSPWSLRFEPIKIAAFHVIERGSCWLKLDEHAKPIPLTGGDVLVLPQGTGHNISDEADNPPFVSIWLDQETATESRNLYYGGEGRSTVLLCGTFEFEPNAAQPLLDLLPPGIHIKGEDGKVGENLEATLRAMAKEADVKRPGSQILLRRLADILFVQVVRIWLEDEKSQKQGWLGALRDQQIGKALGLMHSQPANDWTVEDLAMAVAMSRSGFAARFRDLVGEPPLQYLTHRRMVIAADLLSRSRLEMPLIAEKTGYKSEEAFSKAFKRFFKVAPGAYRRQSLSLYNSTAHK